MIEYLILLWLIQYRRAFGVAPAQERREPVERGLEIGAGIDFEDAPEPERSRPKLRIVK